MKIVSFPLINEEEDWRCKLDKYVFLNEKHVLENIDQAMNAWFTSFKDYWRWKLYSEIYIVYQKSKLLS